MNLIKQQGTVDANLTAYSTESRGSAKQRNYTQLNKARKNVYGNESTEQGHESRRIENKEHLRISVGIYRYIVDRENFKGSWNHVHYQKL